VGNILPCHGSAPERQTTTTWKECTRTHLEVLVATDLGTAAVWTWGGLMTSYILGFIHLGNQKVPVAGMTPVGSRNQTSLVLCREHRIVWGRMVAIGQIALANTYDGPFVAVVIEIKEPHHHPARGCLPHNA
jgi:hypothetical protein